MDESSVTSCRGTAYSKWGRAMQTLEQFNGVSGPNLCRWGAL